MLPLLSYNVGPNSFDYSAICTFCNKLLITYLYYIAMYVSARVARLRYSSNLRKVILKLYDSNEEMSCQSGRQFFS
ncbi:hypothetical protein GYMLUDRAFT_597616 [Collybiopsis luxurians FD-317 M1]|uniref:Uncharacterized protein n=1 Tax=Collybiopsis luxurians FD-317 M1 TaxID=944289 RepID=A0A0D0CXD6_9AGAR|nr:hypothetical protein GYMLUDRAFT_597616 [Collybiopsis luxurians FD-317 M1]